MKPEPYSVAMGTVNHILRAARELGADIDALVAKTGLDRSRLSNPLARLPIATVTRLLNQLQVDFNDGLIAIRLGLIAGPKNFSDAGFAQLYAANLRDGLCAEITIQSIRHNIFAVEMVEGASALQLQWQLDADDAQEAAAFSEFSMAILLQYVRRVSGYNVTLGPVSFQHKPRSQVDAYGKILDCDVEFCAERTIGNFSHDLTLRPNAAARPDLQHASLARYVRASDLLQQGKKLTGHCYLFLYLEMDKAQVSLRRMANVFGMTERTARRQLRREGSNFKQIVENARRELWLLYRMEGTRPIGEISNLLGYSSPSAFTRAHTRWYGTPPSHSDARPQEARSAFS